ncbi:MAG: MBL fold metallo-hydrolase [Candidatus Eremiobacteraeota bacterium]|nr:MBL fold metallo-hydrolase [Candidatus Eremiobacteraeota bacterium]
MLEDEFIDVFGKAMRGTRTSADRLAESTGFSESAIAAWAKGSAVPNDDQAQQIARSLQLDPTKFADAAAVRWHPEPLELPDVRVHAQQSTVPSNGYLFFLEGSRRAALVDPAGDPQKLIRIVRERGYDLQYILITHKHDDHCDAAPAVAAAFPQATIVMHDADVFAIGKLASNATLVRDGEELDFGDDAKIRMLHTPGHTDGSTSFVYGSAVFTGDTLFAASVGGAYGDKSTYADILKSIRSRLLTLPDETVVMPGHGPPSKIRWEKDHNPFFPVQGGIA